MDTKRIKLQHFLDFSSDPPHSEISTSVTTLKVYLSWCKSDNGGVFDHVNYFRKKLWERGVSIVDTDVKRFVGEERYVPIVILSLGYFYDADCLNELEFICKLPHFMPKLCVFYDHHGEMQAFYDSIMEGQDRQRPLRVPMNTQWYPPPPPPDDDAAAEELEDDGMGGVDSVDGDVDNDGGGDSGDVDNDGGGDVDDDEDEEEDYDYDSDLEEEARREAHFITMRKIALEEEKTELTLGRALCHITTYAECPEDTVFESREAEHAHIDNFAMVIWMFLNPASLDYTNLVGLESHLDQLKPYLLSGEESMYIAITGQEGSGKTTMAKYLYNRFCHFHPFFHHTRMISDPTSLTHLELAAKVFDDLAGFSRDDSFNPEELDWIASSYESLPLLIVFDNINSASDLDHVAPVLNLMPENGSKVVFVTKDDSWLKEYQRRIQTFPIPSLDVKSSLELFCLRAFKQNQPPKRYVDLADNVVKRAKGIPSELVHCAAQFGLMEKDYSWTKAFDNDEDMDSLFWSKYVPRYSKPATTGPKNETRKKESYLWLLEDNPIFMRAHSTLWSQIFAYMDTNAFDTEPERAQLILGHPREFSFD